MLQQNVSSNREEDMKIKSPVCSLAQSGKKGRFENINCTQSH